MQVITRTIARANDRYIHVTTIQCSHFHMFDADQDAGKFGSIKIAPLVLNMYQTYGVARFRRILIAHTSNPDKEFSQTQQLPKPAYLCLLQDKERLHQFCPTREENPHINAFDQIRNDSVLLRINGKINPCFRDDGNT